MDTALRTLDDVWSIAEMATHARRGERAVREWLARQYDHLPMEERSLFARRLGGNAGWLINSRHPLIQTYVSREPKAGRPPKEDKDQRLCTASQPEPCTSPLH